MEFNYYLAKKLGRKLLIKYGKYIFVKEATVDKMDAFFKEHGPFGPEHPDIQITQAIKVHLTGRHQGIAIH